jgi:uncharacterized coiled-coil protein SlyX
MGIEPGYDHGPPQRRGNLITTLGLPGIINAVVVTVALIAWLVTTHNQAETAPRDLARMEAALTEKIADLRAVVTSGQSDVRQQISVLPDQRARIEILEQRMADLDQRISSVGSIVASQEKTQAEHGANLNILMRTVNTPLGRTR